MGVIAKMYPQTSDPSAQFTLDFTHFSGLAALLAIIDAVPPELITVDGNEFAAFVGARGALSAHIQRCQAQGKFAGHLAGSNVALIRHVLEKCPDQGIPTGVSSLAFITPADLREALRSDIAEVERALVEAEWKSATVVAGSIIEALILWALDQQRVKAQAVGAALVSNATKAPLEEWTLHHYVEVAHKLKIIKNDTADQVRLAKDFRNLIHPGRAQRLAQNCDRATARAAAAGIDFVIRDLMR